MIKPIIIELSIDYVLADNNMINLSTDTSDERGFEFSILDVDKSKQTQRTSVSTNDPDEMIEIINDFKDRWNSIKKD
jgi:hypothetical protein